MKQFVSAVFAVLLLASCSKQEIITPEPAATTPAANIFYKDANIAIADVAVTPVGSSVRLQFSSLYERNVVKMEVLSGPYQNMLCFIHEQPINSNSSTRRDYLITEANATSNSRVYFIKYTLRSGAWIMSPAIRFER